MAQDVLPHPRMGLNAAFLQQIDALRKSKDPVWKNFQEWISKKKDGWNGYTYIGQDEDGFLLGYAITKDKKLFEMAFTGIAKSIYNDPANPASGLKPFFDTDCKKAIYCDAHVAAFKGGGLVALVARLFDYGYDRLSAQQKTDIMNWLNTATTTLVGNPYATTYFRNDGGVTLRGLNAIYLATLGENPKAETISKAWHSAWKEQLEALSRMSQGGSMGEGNGYGAVTMWTLVDIANSTFYATGEDLFKSSPAFQARLAYDAFSTYPKRLFDQNDPWYSHAAPTPEPAAIAGDGARQSGWTTMILPPIGRMLARHFAGTEEADIWNWVFAQKETNRVDDPWLALYTYAPPPRLVKPKRLSWWAKGNGMIYVRQNWDSQDATWIGSWAGPHFDIHQHLDQGAFDLFKRRNLVPSTGDYDASAVGTPHWLNYYSRTVATNNILVGDPNEYFWGFWSWTGCAPPNSPWAGVHTLYPLPSGEGKACIVNDGGQRTMLPQPMSIFHVKDYDSAKAIYDVAKVIDFADDNVDVARWTMDTTNAYMSAAAVHAKDGNGTPFTNPNKPKVVEVKRRMVYSRAADVLVVGDTVESTNPAFEKSDVFHALEELQVLDGTKTNVSPGEDVYTGAHITKITMDDTHPHNKGQITGDYRLGYASAFIETVFPQDARLRVIGGREPSNVEHPEQGQTNPAKKQTGHFHTHIKDFWVKDYSEGVQPDHKSANWPPIYPADRSDTQPSMLGGFGVSRLEVQPAKPGKRDYFLNVIQPTLDPKAAPLKTTPVESETEFGVSFTAGGKLYKVMFPKTGDGPARVEH